MRRLIYTSRSTIQDDPDQINAIVNASRARNEANGITGVLWSNHTCFAQVLEGDADAIDRTMSRIRADPRHAEIEIVSDRAVSSRAFGTWAMARSNDSDEGTARTAFLVGFALSAGTEAAQRLYDIIVADFC